MKKKPVSAVLALFLGYLGAHRFYLGQRAWGVAYFALFFFLFSVSVDEGEPWVFLSILVGFLDAVLLSVMPQEEFDHRFNRPYLDKAPVYREPRAPVRRREDSEELHQLKAAGVRSFRQHNYEAALDAFEDALEIAPRDPSVHFNIACCYARLERAAPAVEHLELAIENGFDRPEKLHSHPAFSWLRRQPIFRNFIENDYRVPPLQLPQPQEELVLPPQPVNGTAAAAPSAEEMDLDTSDLLERITKLGELRERGILTEEEFAEQKRRLLG